MFVVKAIPFDYLRLSSQFVFLTKIFFEKRNLGSKVIRCCFVICDSYNDLDPYPRPYPWFSIWLHFAVVCLLLRIFALKNKFLTSSKHFSETNFRKHFFELATNHIYINMKCLDDVRCSHYSKFFSWAFQSIMAPKNRTPPKCRD